MINYDIIEVIEEFICPISNQYFLEPIKTRNGIFIEKAEFLNIISSNRNEINRFESCSEFNSRLKNFYDQNPIYLLFRYQF